MGIWASYSNHRPSWYPGASFRWMRPGEYSVHYLGCSMGTDLSLAMGTVSAQTEPNR
mgnify:CR=1 FL=1